MCRPSFRFLPGSQRVCGLVGRCHLRHEMHRAERYEKWFGRRTVCRGTDKFVARNTKTQDQEGRRVYGARWAAMRSKLSSGAFHSPTQSACTPRDASRQGVAVQPFHASNRGCRCQAIGLGCAVHEPSRRPYQQREPRSSESTQPRLSARCNSNLWVKTGHVRSLTLLF